MTALRIILIVIKLLLLFILLLVLSPFIALWLFVKYRVFRFNLIRHMKKYGVPKAAAKSMAREMKPGNLFRMLKR